jgi:hypothetical protein
LNSRAETIEDWTTAVRASDLPRNIKRFAVLMAEPLDDETRFEAYASQLAELWMCTERTVSDNVREMQDAGWLHRERQHWGPSTYTLTIPEENSK